MATIAAFKTLTEILGMTESVKGCQMPAPRSKQVSTRERSAGRRLISLEGGNRGMRPHGQGRQ